MALDASTGRVYPVTTLPLHEHTPGMVCFDEVNQVYYLIGIRLAGDNKVIFSTPGHILELRAALHLTVCDIALCACTGLQADDALVGCECADRGRTS